MLPVKSGHFRVLGQFYYKYMYSNILTKLDYRAEDVVNLAQVQIDWALSARLRLVLSVRSICTQDRLQQPWLRNLNL